MAHHAARCELCAHNPAVVARELAERPRKLREAREAMRATALRAEASHERERRR